MSSAEPSIPQDLSQTERVSCNICGSTATQPVPQKLNFSLVQCLRCGLVYTNPRAFHKKEDDYSKGATIEIGGQIKTDIASLYSDILYNLGNRVLVGKLLDVGCALGHFMAFAKRYGWEVEGVERSPYAECAAQNVGAKVHGTVLLKDARLTQDFYHACVLVEVVEHLADPRETIEEVWRLLQPGGMVFLTTSNFASYRSLLLREEWDPAIPAGTLYYGNLYYFDSVTLENLLSSAGFINVENLSSRDDELTSGGLVMCARKPWDSTYRPSPAFKRSFAGRLVRRPGETPEDQKVYYVENGRKRWVTTADWIIAKGMAWPGDLQFITAEELDAILTGPPLP